MLNELFGAKQKYSIELWIGWVTLIVAIFSFYLPEGKKFSLFAILFLLIGTILIAKAFFTSKISLVDKDKRLNKVALLVFAKAIEYMIIWNLLGFVVAIILFPNTDLIFLVMWTFILMFLYIDLYRNKYLERLKNNKLNPTYGINSIIACLILLVILFILRLFAGTATSFFEKVLLNTSQVSPLIITLLILLIIRTLCQLGFNHMKHKKLFLKENLKKTNPKLIGGTIAMIFIIIFVALVCVIQPNIGHQPSTQTKIDACITQSTYTINEDPFLLNLTMHSIPDRNYMNIQLYLNAILERHGDFNKIQVFNNPDKSLEQYYDVTVVRDLGFISIKFYNKDIYKMYNLELLVDENICARSEK